MRSTLVSALMLGALGAVFVDLALAREADATPPDLTAEQDHRLMMQRLGITEIRQGANGRQL
jgi:hypothetical protein